MLQRIQSIYLLLASVAILALFFFPLAHDVNVNTVLTTFKVDGMYNVESGKLIRTTSFLALTIVTVVMAIIPLIIVFRYKERKQQIALAYGFILVLIGFSFWMTQTVKTMSEGTLFRTENYGIGALMPTVAIIFTLLAVKGIKNDEKLVKSADRLR
jgi:glucan phosphoethanolaminetransferase (alkaline phosphatase superfamily)